MNDDGNNGVARAMVNCLIVVLIGVFLGMFAHAAAERNWHLAAAWGASAAMALGWRVERSRSDEYRDGERFWKDYAKHIDD